MLIERKQQIHRTVGDISEVLTDTIRIELPDSEPTINIVVKPVLDLYVDGSRPKPEPREGRMVYSETSEPLQDHACPFDAHEFQVNRRHARELPLWQFARHFFATEFDYLGPHGADEMADRFFARWKAHRA